MGRKKAGSSWNQTVQELSRRRRLFEDLVANALDELPEPFQAQLENVGVVIEDGVGTDATLGLYHGIPRTERGGDYTGVLPDLITIYRRPIEARCRTEEELAREVKITVWHEIAHHFGIDDDRLRELGME